MNNNNAKAKAKVKAKVIHQQLLTRTNCSWFFDLHYNSVTIQLSKVSSKLK